MILISLFAVAALAALTFFFAGYWAGKSSTPELRTHPEAQ